MSKKKPSIQNNAFVQFLQHKHVMSILIIFIIIGSFFILALLGDSEQAMVGKAQSVAEKGEIDPYFMIYNYYSFYKEKPTFEEFNDALYRSNVFLRDSSIKYGKERAVMKNTYSSVRELVNKVYYNTKIETLQEIAQWLIIEDSFKELVFDVSMNEIKTVNLPINPQQFRFSANPIPSPGPSIFFLDCLSSSNPIPSPRDSISIEQVSYCLQTGKETDKVMELWNPNPIPSP